MRRFGTYNVASSAPSARSFYRPSDRLAAHACPMALLLAQQSEPSSGRKPD
jgi:hypothetical protein